MSRIDYSKWDKLEISDSEDSDELMPQVERFAQPSSVSFGGGKVSVSSSAPTQSIQPAQPPSAQPNTPESFMQQITRNGGRSETFYWAQGRDMVTLRFTVPKDSKAKQVRIDLSERHIQVAAPDRLLDAELAFPVKTDADSLEDFWELEDNPLDSSTRLLSVTLKKSLLALGEDATFWWNRVLLADQPLDSSAFQDRRNKSAKNFKQVWDEAHAMFRERVKNTKQQEIDVE
jgi:hypothetical protein